MNLSDAEQPTTQVLESDPTTQILVLPFTNILGKAHHFSVLPFLHLPDRVNNRIYFMGSLWTLDEVASSTCLAYGKHSINIRKKTLVSTQYLFAETTHAFHTR